MERKAAPTSWLHMRPRAWRRQDRTDGRRLPAPEAMGTAHEAVRGRWSEHDGRIARRPFPDRSAERVRGWG